MRATRMVAFSVDIPPLVPQQHEAPLVWANLDAIWDAAERFRIPVTWCVSSTGDGTFAERIRHSPCGHEYALLAEPHWFAGRTQMAKLVSQAVERAQTWGFHPRLLALQGSYTVSELDLLVRHQIGVVREALVASRHRRRTSVTPPRPLSARFGLWWAPVHQSFGAPIPWWCGGVRFAVLKFRSMLRGSTQLVSVGLDVTAAAHAHTHLGHLAVKLFRLCHQGRQRGLWTVVPLSYAVLSVADALRGSVEGMTSVLRRTA